MSATPLTDAERNLRLLRTSETLRQHFAEMNVAALAWDQALKSFISAVEKVNANR